MLRKMFFTLTLAILVLTSACAPQTTPTPAAQIANPASVNCEQKGGTLEIRADETGGQIGVCVFPDKSECEEWALMREECKPGDSLATPEPAPATEELDSNGWKIYQNEALGYSFHYPANTTIIENADPTRSITITAIAAGWPNITVTHPADREDYRPPEGTDLAQWLTDHNLLMSGEQQPAGEIRKDDVPIAGTTAIHTRFERSQQCFAYDKYFLTHNGQLYVIVFGHTNDTEDWDLYTQFLQNFSFEK